MKILLKISIAFQLALMLYSNSAVAQTPATRNIHIAYQSFLGCNVELRLLIADQGISPRVLRAADNAEKIVIMFTGNWLDLTDEVSVSGTGVSFSRFVRRGNNANGILDFNFSELFPLGTPAYNGTYCTVEFVITADASFGTHTVKLKRPRLGGKDETEFYIEVIDAARIDCINFLKTGDNVERNMATEGDVGTVIIGGKNLRKITSINNSSWFSGITNISILPNRISFRASLANDGEFGYSQLMAMVSGNAASHPQYPKGQRVVRGSSTTNQVYKSSLLIRRPAANTTPLCNFFTSRLQPVSVNGTPPKQPKLDVSFIGNKFISPINGNLLPEDISSNSLCPTAAQPNINRQLQIGDLIIRVTNSGDTTSRPSVLHICTNTNSNFDCPPTVDVRSLAPGGFFEFTTRRRVNVVSVITNNLGVCTRSPANTNGIARWNDLGIVASIYTQRINGLMASNASIQ